jgi:ABC-type multidrug transport system ATPase subunit
VSCFLSESFNNSNFNYFYSYALMGSSGCGKTTLMSCIIGLDRLNSGSIEIFSKLPTEIDKSRIGFMPQECALTFEFSVRENFWFFGTIFGMTAEKIAERFKFLSNLLELPGGDQLIKNCSGGQQRRISFAVTLIHEPELLILDEPTVGLDPLLRSKIWDYLVGLAKRNVTVLLSTHYIEEARQSDIVGIMRNGVLVAEDSSESILSTCGSSNLEEAFIMLSQRQDANLMDLETAQRINESRLQDEDFQSTSTAISNAESEEKQGKFLKALLWKHLVQIFRNPG